MNCLEFNQRLQAMLDGAAVAHDPDAAAHLAQCPACRELNAAARVLAGGLQSLPRPQPSALLTQSIVSAVFDDRRQRVRRVRQRVAITFALAASIVILMLVGWLNQGPRPDLNKLVKAPLPEEPAAPKLIERADDARSAVTAWTERVAGETKEQAKLLLAVANTFDLPPMASLTELSELQEPLDPAAKSLRQATQTVADGMEPITNSARRAFTFFVKELPVFDIPARN